MVLKKIGESEGAVKKRRGYKIQNTQREIYMDKDGLVTHMTRKPKANRRKVKTLKGGRHFR